jgi:ABC-type glutathione transport system ATPase component
MTVPHQPADVEVGADAPEPEADAPPSGVRADAVTGAPPLDGTKGQPALVADQLTKRFGVGERTAFSEVSFQVAYGEVFGFLGPNGVGKTNIGI